jgi:hypothetical protein
MALVLYPGREGIAYEVHEETTLGRSILTFRYLQISLPRLEATDFVQAEHVLGAAMVSLMHLPTDRSAQIALHLAALRRVHLARLAGEIDDARAFLLVNLIATYLPLSAGEQAALRVQLEQEGDLVMEATELTWADQVYRDGRAEGRVQGLREAIEQLVRVRYGRVNAELAARLAAMTREEDLRELVARIGKAQSETDLLA